VDLLERAAKSQVTAVSVETFDYLVKGKRASFLRAWLGDMLKQRPMISFVDGVLKSVGRYSTHDDPTEQTAKFYQERLPGKRRVWVAIAHGDDAHSAERLLAHLKTAFDVKYAYVRPLSASIYLHGGRGALFSSVLPLEPLPWQPPPLTLANALNK
jgi:fatty acid-binding protein DegV